MEKEYLNLEEAAAHIGIKRASLYNYMADLKIRPVKLGRSRKKYLAMNEVKRLKAYKEKPWSVEENRPAA